MGKPLVSQFQKRFGDRISAVYTDRPRNLTEQRTRGEVLVKAITQVIAGIIRREPTQDELLGLTDLSKAKPRQKT